LNLCCFLNPITPNCCIITRRACERKTQARSYNLRCVSFIIFGNVQLCRELTIFFIAFCDFCFTPVQIIRSPLVVSGRLYLALSGDGKKNMKPAICRCVTALIACSVPADKRARYGIYVSVVQWCRVVPPGINMNIGDDLLGRLLFCFVDC
jgi:hypothetical protein